MLITGHKKRLIGSAVFFLFLFFSPYAIDTMLRWGRKHWKLEATSYPTSGNDIIALSTFIKSWTLGSLEPFFSSATVGPVAFLVIQLVALVGIMKRVLCSDWLPEWARWAHLPRSGLPALIPFKKKKLREADWQSSWLFGQSRRWRRKQQRRTFKTKET